MALFVLVLCSSAAFFFFRVWRQPLNLTQTQKIIITEGMNAQAVLKRCAPFIRHPKILRWLLTLNGYQKRLQSGHYLVVPGMTVAELFNHFKLGKEIQNKVKIQEGTTFKQMILTLKGVNGLNYDLENLDEKQIMGYLNLSGIHPEGRFAPDTYYYVAGMLASQVLKISYLAQQQRLEKWWHFYHGEKIYKCVYEWLILASCLEKESQSFEEQRLIAGIILKRLKLRMKLQLDPTVIYGLGEQYRGKLTKAILKQRSSYNTYLRYGLPPTPICMPSESALKAALQPNNDQGYLYYVAKPDGFHHFSKTYLEHQQAIQKYLLKDKK